MSADPRDPFAPGPFAPLLAGGAPPVAGVAPPRSIAGGGAPLSPTGQPGGPTPREMAAVKKLARAVLECLLAFDEGHLLRACEKGISLRSPSAPGDPGPEALLLTPKEAARRLAVSVKTLTRLTRPAGPVPCVRIGRQVRYAPADLAAAVRTLQTT